MQHVFNECRVFCWNCLSIISFIEFADLIYSHTHIKSRFSTQGIWGEMFMNEPVHVKQLCNRAFVWILQIVRHTIKIHLLLSGTMFPKSHPSSMIMIKHSDITNLIFFKSILKIWPQSQHISACDSTGKLANRLEIWKCCLRFNPNVTHLES